MAEGPVGGSVHALITLDTSALIALLDRRDSDHDRVSRYADLPLGFHDASVVACAERSGGRVLTLDERDFRVVAGEGRIEVLP
ncbi:MAG: hypothetical protein ACJ77A_00285 [Actinomycetota bacterium]